MTGGLIGLNTSSCHLSLPSITAPGPLPRPSLVFWDFNKYLSWTCNWIRVFPWQNGQTRNGFSRSRPSQDRCDPTGHSPWPAFHPVNSRLQGSWPTDSPGSWTQCPGARLQQEALASRSAASLVRSPPQAEPEPHANSPPPYDGDPSSCRAFLSNAPWSLHSSLAVTSWRSLRWHSWSPSWMGGPVIGQLLCGMLVPHSVPHFRISEQRWLSCLTDLLRVTRQPPSWRGWIRMVAQSRTIPSSLEHWRPPATGMKLLCALDFGRGWMMRSRTRLLLTSCLVILTPLWNWLCVWRGVFSVAVSGGLLDPPEHWARGLPVLCPCLLTLCSWPGAHAGGTSTPHSQGEAGSTGSRSLSVLREAWTQSHPVSFKSRGPSVSRGILMGASPCFESPKSRTLLPVSVNIRTPFIPVLPLLIQELKAISWIFLLRRSGAFLPFLSLLPSLSVPSMAFSSPPSPTPLLQ